MNIYIITNILSWLSFDGCFLFSSIEATLIDEQQ